MAQNILDRQVAGGDPGAETDDGKQQQKALVLKGMPYYEFDGKIDRTVILPDSKFKREMEPDVRFRGPKADLPGLPISEVTPDQKEAMQKVIASLLAPYRKNAWRYRAASTGAI